MTAERKVWRQVALMMFKDETVTISSALNSIQHKSRFWALEIDEFCVRRQVKGHKGEGKASSRSLARAKAASGARADGLARASTRTGQKGKETMGAGTPGSRETRLFRRLKGMPVRTHHEPHA